eukprot:392859-Pleurochrysis_carterae.AAC.2
MSKYTNTSISRRHACGGERLQSHRSCATSPGRSLSSCPQPYATRPLTMMRTHFSLALLLAPAQHANAFSSVPACDAQALRTARFATLAGFSAPFGVFTRLPWNATLTLDEFVDALAPHFEEDFEVTAPCANANAIHRFLLGVDGAGKYKGLRKAAEYLMVGIAPTNLGFWSTVGTTGGFSSLVEEGDAITTVTETATAYFFGQHPGNGTEQINRRARRWQGLHFAGVRVTVCVCDCVPLRVGLAWCGYGMSLV